MFKNSDIEEPGNGHEKTLPSKRSGWKVSTSGDGDTAMALFSETDEVHEESDPKEAKKLERKIDFMILPYLTVCYAFFYIGGQQYNFLIQLCSGAVPKT